MMIRISAGSIYADLSMPADHLFVSASPAVTTVGGAGIAIAASEYFNASFSVEGPYVTII
jgi:hypothetical protein